MKYFFYIISIFCFNNALCIQDSSVTRLNLRGEFLYPHFFEGTRTIEVLKQRNVNKSVGFGVSGGVKKGKFEITIGFQRITTETQGIIKNDIVIGDTLGLTSKNKYIVCPINFAYAFKITDKLILNVFTSFSLIKNTYSKGFYYKKYKDFHFSNPGREVDNKKNYDVKKHNASMGLGIEVDYLITKGIGVYFKESFAIYSKSDPGYYLLDPFSKFGNKALLSSIGILFVFK